MDGTAFCRLAQDGSAETLRHALDSLSTSEQTSLLATRQRRGVYGGMLPIHVAAKHNSSCSVMRLLVEMGVDKSGLELATHYAEKGNTEAVLRVLTAAEEMQSLQDGTTAPADAHEGLSKKDFRTYSKFYRDPADFEIVENEALWELGKWALQRPESQRTIEAWSVGCSAGEEVFSVLASWEQAVWPHLGDVDLHFLGTDLSAHAVDAARRAEYGVHAVQDVPESSLTKCFTEGKSKDGQPTYHVTPALKQRATFIQQDVNEEMPRDEKRFDLVLCRYSVFLYCSKEEAVEFLRDLCHRLLRPGGFLFIGAPDELPQTWRSLGLQEWRGHRGLYRLGDDPVPYLRGTAGFGGFDPKFMKESLTEFLGKPRAASERIGRPDAGPEVAVLTREQIQQNVKRFEKWEETKRVRAAALKEKAEKEETGMRKEVYLSGKKRQEFVERMQNEATRREEGLKKAKGELESKRRIQRRKETRRKALVMQRSMKGPTKETDKEAVLKAKNQAAEWMERRNKLPKKQPGFGGGNGRPTTAGHVGNTWSPHARQQLQRRARPATAGSRDAAGASPAKLQANRPFIRPADRAEMLCVRQGTRLSAGQHQPEPEPEPEAAADSAAPEGFRAPVATHDGLLALPGSHARATFQKLASLRADAGLSPPASLRPPHGAPLATAVPADGVAPTGRWHEPMQLRSDSDVGEAAATEEEISDLAKAAAAAAAEYERVSMPFSYTRQFMDWSKIKGMIGRDDWDLRVKKPGAAEVRERPPMNLADVAAVALRTAQLRQKQLQKQLVSNGKDADEEGQSPVTSPVVSPPRGAGGAAVHGSERPRTAHATYKMENPEWRVADSESRMVNQMPRRPSSAGGSTLLHSHSRDRRGPVGRPPSAGSRLQPPSRQPAATVGALSGAGRAHRSTWPAIRGRPASAAAMVRHKVAVQAGDEGGACGNDDNI